MAAAFRFGLHFWQLPLDDWQSRVRRYEALGFSSITFTDHLVVPQSFRAGLHAVGEGALPSLTTWSFHSGSRLRR